MSTLILVGAVVLAVVWVVSAFTVLLYGLAAGLSRPRLSQRQTIEAHIGPTLAVLAFGAVLVSAEIDYGRIGAIIGGLFVAAWCAMGVPSRARAFGRWYARRRLRRHAV